MRLFGFLIAMVLANPCWGAFVTVARFDRVDSLGGGNFGGIAGGEFRVTFGKLAVADTNVSKVQWEANAYQYRTFCIELNETLALSTPTNLSKNNVFKVAFSDRSVSGGSVHTDEPTVTGDRISRLSKTIYNDWITNRPIVTNNASNGAANDVQQALWKEEDGRAPTDSIANHSTVAKVNQLLSKSGSDVPGVMVMNVFGWDTTNAKMGAFKADDATTWTGMIMKQDQIIKIGGFEGGLPQVPEPATVALMGFGMVLTGLYGRRRR